jgi:hypothetical protein
MVDREAGSGHRGVGVLRRLVNERDPEYQASASELQAPTRRLLTRAGIPFVEEFVKLLGSPVVVEADGRANHSSKLDWQHDLDRRNLLTAQGLGVIHATWATVTTRPDEFLAEVARAEASHVRRRT